MIFYFKLQYKRSIRSLREFGLNPFLGVILIFGLFVLLSNLLFKRISHPQYIYVVLAIMFTFPLGNAKRNEFLKNIFLNNEYRKIRLVENMLIASPFVFFLALQHFFILSLTALICGMLSSLYNEWGKSSFVIFSPFSKEPFEFTVGFRKSYWLLAILYILTIISISVGNFNLGVAALLGVMLVCMNFYSITEPIFYVWIYTQQPKYFLIGKVKTAMLYSISLVLPLMILLSVFYPAKVFIILGITLIGLLYIAMSVVAKYTNYPAQINLLQIIKLGAGVIFPPFMLIIIPHFYLQSIRKLNVYLK